jgi:hypothetical protein
MLRQKIPGLNSVLKRVLTRYQVPLYLLLCFIIFDNPAQAQFDYDPANYYIGTGDCAADPGEIVRVPIRVRIGSQVGGFLIRFTYDRGFLEPLPVDNCQGDACDGFCCDASDIYYPDYDPTDPTYDFVLTTVYDSLELIGSGIRTMYIDSSSAQDCAIIYDPNFDTTYNTFALHSPYDFERHDSAVFVQFLPMIPPTNDCELQYWTQPVVDTLGYDIVDNFQTIVYINMRVNPDAVIGTSTRLEVVNYQQEFAGDPADDLRYNQFASPEGDLGGAIIVPDGAGGVAGGVIDNLRDGIFTVGAVPFDCDTCTWGCLDQGTVNERCAPMPSECASCPTTCQYNPSTQTWSCPQPGNNPPVVTVIPNSYTIDQGQTVTFTVSATDVDNDNISLLATGLPSGAAFAPSNPVTGSAAVSGTFMWTPSFSQSGGFTVTFTATDGPGDSRSALVSITVNKVEVDKLYTTSSYGASPVGGIPGATPVIFPIDLVTTRTVYGVQFDMIYPYQIVDIDSIVVTDLTAEYVVYDNLGEYPDSIRVITFGLANEPILEQNDNSAILNAYMTIDSTSQPADYWVHFRNAWESIDPDPSEPSLPLLADSGVVQVDLLGDVNLDKLINVADMVNVVGYIIGNYGLPKRNFETADVVIDQAVNVVDLVGIINMAFGRPLEPPQTAPSFSGPLAKVIIEHDDLAAGQFTKLNIQGEFPDDIAGVQLQIDYDANAMALEKPELSEESGAFSMAFNDDKSGRMKVVLYTYKPWEEQTLIPAGLADVIRIPAWIKQDIAADDESSIQITQVFLSNAEANEILTERNPILPSTFKLYQNYPNPFNPNTIIDFDISHDGASNGLSRVKLEVMNILGQKVRTLMDNTVGQGRYSVEWNGTDDMGNPVATGIYLYRLEVDKRYQSKKMLLLK